MPRVSVIVPARNAGPFVATALGSVVVQTYEDWELLVVDDASTDDTAVVAASVSQRVPVIRAPHPLRAAGARNLGIRQARGELIGFLDADDWWSPEFLERQVALFDREASKPGPPVCIVACDARVADGDGWTARSYLEQFRRGVEPVTVERLLRRNVVFVSALVPRALGEAVGWFDEHLPAAEDYGLWLKLVEQGGRVVVNREVLAVYRRTDASVSLDLAKQAACNLRVLSGALERGCLTARQRRIAAQELRYNRALGAVAQLGAGRPSRETLRTLPNVLWVALSRPGNWADWYRALRPS